MDTSLFYQEQELVALVKERDRAAFNYLYQKYSPALYSVISRRIKDEHTAADILQEVFVNIFKNIDMYDSSKGRFYTWMHKIAQNKSLDFFSSGLHNIRSRSGELTPHHSLLTEQSTNIIGIKKLIGNLQPKYTAVVNMFYFNGYTMPEIAAHLQIPIGTVKTRLRYAIDKLRKDYTYTSSANFSWAAAV